MKTRVSGAGLTLAKLVCRVVADGAEGIEMAGIPGAGKSTLAKIGSNYFQETYGFPSQSAPRNLVTRLYHRRPSIRYQIMRRLPNVSSRASELEQLADESLRAAAALGPGELGFVSRRNTEKRRNRILFGCGPTESPMIDPGALSSMTVYLFGPLWSNASPRQMIERLETVGPRISQDVLLVPSDVELSFHRIQSRMKPFPHIDSLPLGLLRDILTAYEQVTEALIHYCLYTGRRVYTPIASKQGQSWPTSTTAEKVFLAEIQSANREKS